MLTGTHRAADLEAVEVVEADDRNDFPRDGVRKVSPTNLERQGRLTLSMSAIRAIANLVFRSRCSQLLLPPPDCYALRTSSEIVAAAKYELGALRWRLRDFDLL